MGTLRLMTFSSYELRTTEPEPARAFYADVVGTVPPIGHLPLRARARGAPAHWLGHVAVADVAASAARFVAQGGEQLGPIERIEGGELAVVRDPFGSVLALRSTTQTTQAVDAVVWHQLHCHDDEAALAFYAEQFGWAGVDALAHGDDRFLVFAWDDVGPPVGTIANTARRPGVHPHWLFYFAVPRLDDALERAQQRGGELLRGPIRRPDGSRLAVCHDPQGAELGLVERARRPGV